MIYLDNNATTRPDPRVVEAMVQACEEWWANPSSVHRMGQEARHRVELARRDVADLLNTSPRQITFTSGGTEAIAHAIDGMVVPAAERRQGPAVVVSCRTEHAAVRDRLDDLERRRLATVRWVPVDREGMVDLEALAAALAGADLASFQWANNETGVVLPVTQIARLCRAAGVPFHCDATQWIGKEPADLSAPEVPDLLTFAPHKFHGPKGVGVLWTRPGVVPRPIILGTQELGRRGGTENVPGILGCGMACRIARHWLEDPEPRRRLAALRDRFEQRVLAVVPEAQVNGPCDPARRIWNTSNIAFPRLEAEALLLMLSERGVCASAGAACSSGSLDPSPVLLAMGIPEPLAHGSLRFSLSRETTEAEVDQAATIIGEVVADLKRSLAAVS